MRLNDSPSGPVVGIDVGVQVLVEALAEDTGTKIGTPIIVSISDPPKNMLAKRGPTTRLIALCGQRGCSFFSDALTGSNDPSPLGVASLLPRRFVSNILQEKPGFRPPF